MTCVECRREMEQRYVAIRERMGGGDVLVENVPAWVCPQCGQREISGPVLVAIEALAEALAAEERMGGGRGSRPLRVAPVHA